MGARTHSLRAAAGAVAILAGLWSPLAGQTTSSGPAATAASQPLLPEAEPQPQPLSIAPAAGVEEALRYTDEERIILDDINIRDASLDTAALPVLLCRAQMLPTDRSILTEADRPNLKNLWREPQRWRYRLVRVEGKFQLLENFRAKPSRRWGTRAVYVLHLVETQTGQNRRLIIMLTRKPAGEMRRDQRIELAGIFYKLARLSDSRESPETAELVDFPVLVAGAVFDAGAGDAGLSLPPKVVATIAVVVLLLVVFILLRVRLGRRPAPGGRYKPLRSERVAEAGNEDNAVDEELRRQVRAFEQGRRDQAGKENADNEKDCG